MYVKEAVIKCPYGLRARAATLLTQKANEFTSGIWIEKDNHRINAKSLLGVLSMAIICGTEISIIGDGADEVMAVDELCALASSDFAE